MSKGSVDRGTIASPMALAMAVMKRANAWTIERMFFGALVKAYSRDVMEARISEMAIRT